MPFDFKKEYKEFYLQPSFSPMRSIGPYDSGPAIIRAMNEYAAKQGYALNFTDARRHHGIYLSDPRRCAPEKLRTVMRHPLESVED